MNRICMVMALILAVTSSALAGNVYGTITEDGKPVGGTKLEVACGENKHPAATDANGAFKLFVPDKGKCLLKVTYQGQTPSFEINSYDGSVQYDFILEKQGGQYTLKRK